MIVLLYSIVMCCIVICFKNQTNNKPTQVCSPIIPYLERLFERDVIHLTAELNCERAAATAVYAEWIFRLQVRVTTPTPRERRGTTTSISSTAVLLNVSLRRSSIVTIR